MIKILLAEDHNLVRKGIWALLEKIADFEIIGEAENGHDAVDLASQTKPDVIIMDINMPLLNGIQATKKINTINQDIRVIILSMYSDGALVRQALLAGAYGYVLKQALADELVLAIRSAHRGEYFLSPSISGIVLDNFKKSNLPAEDVSIIDELTAREQEVMQLIGEGHTTKSIATLLVISEKTVEKHRTNLMKKLDVNDIAGVVRMAIKYGIIFIDEY